jgi:hypothetical protein
VGFGGRGGGTRAGTHSSRVCKPRVEGVVVATFGRHIALSVGDGICIGEEGIVHEWSMDGLVGDERRRGKVVGRLFGACRLSASGVTMLLISNECTLLWFDHELWMARLLRRTHSLMVHCGLAVNCTHST